MPAQGKAGDLRPEISTSELSTIYAAGESTNTSSARASTASTDTATPIVPTPSRGTGEQGPEATAPPISEPQRRSWFPRAGTWSLTATNSPPPPRASLDLPHDERNCASGNNGSGNKQTPPSTWHPSGDEQQPRHVRSLPAMGHKSRGPSPGTPEARPPATSSEGDGRIGEPFEDGDIQNPLKSTTTTALRTTENDHEVMAGKPSDSTMASDNARSSWFGWWYAPVGTTEHRQEQSYAGPDRGSDTNVLHMQQEMTGETLSDHAVSTNGEGEQSPKTEQSLTQTQLEMNSASSSRSWLGFWYGPPRAQPQSETSEPRSSEDEANNPLPGHQGGTAPTPSPAHTTEISPQNSPPPPVGMLNPARLYNWMFWPGNGQDSEAVRGPRTAAEQVQRTHSDHGTTAGPDENAPAPQESGTTISKQPSRSSLFARTHNPSTSAPKGAGAYQSENGPNFVQLDGKEGLTSTVQIKSRAPNASSATAAETSASSALADRPRNHVLPTFDDCYQLPEQRTMLQQLFNKLRQQRPNADEPIHLKRATTRIKKAVAIGVHGFFPMKLVRTVLGEPTGTSIRFANHAATAIKEWADRNEIDVEIEKIALEGEGKVADRVEMLWKLLQNWIDHVRSADFVFMAAHSQGVVVGIQLLARLVEEGCVDHARIGFLGMAGINLGPFGHLPTTLLTGSARELFEFQKQDSAVHKRYMQALRTVLADKVRILFIGSIDDQLVSLESSTIANISHPYIYRAVFVDGRVHAPDFLSHLVGFALKLRNLGLSDHGLIRELSAPLAGSLYGGEGHSRIYDESAVYDLGIRHALETADCPPVPLRVRPFQLPTNTNPYFLPWSMRGLLEDSYVRRNLWAECQQLLRQFENWHPSNKSLKDVKFRLEGIRSKL